MIITVTNLKGGVGKSTISRNIAVHFAQKGEKVCMVDTDIVQRGTCEWAERREEFHSKIDVFPMSTINGLANDLKTHQNNGYTVIVLDGVPQLEEVTTKMILLSDLLLIPMTPSIEDLKSSEKFLERYLDTKAILEGVRNLHAFIVLNRYSGRNNEDLEMKEALNIFKQEGIFPLNSTLDNRVAHRRSSKYGLTVLEWEDEKAKAEVYQICQEIEKSLMNLIGG